MGEPGDDLNLSVVGTLGGAAGAMASDEVTAEIDVLDRPTVHVEMDKPLHKPGEMVHLRALAFRENGRVADGEPVTLTIDDPDNKKLVEAKLKTNHFGIAQYDWKTTDQTAVGDYEVSFDLDNSTGNASTGTQMVRIAGSRVLFGRRDAAGEDSRRVSFRQACGHGQCAYRACGRCGVESEDRPPRRTGCRGSDGDSGRQWRRHDEPEGGR
jgi:hypothetical protein